MLLRIVALTALVSTVACEEKKFEGSAPQKVAEKPPVAPKPETVDIKPGPDPTPPAPEPEPKEIFRDCDQAPLNKFKAKLYQLPVDTAKLPDYASLNSIKDICLKQLDIVPRKFDEGFPGVDNLIEWFGLDISFDVTIATEGDYKFRLNSDDGSILKIDGNVVISNDGLHDVASKDGTVRLTPGVHRFNVPYYQGPRFNIALELFWTPPGGTESYLPLDIVSRPSP